MVATQLERLDQQLEHVFDLDLAEQNADRSWRLTVPATFVLDSDGIVRAAHVSGDYRTLMEPAAIVATMAALTSPDPNDVTTQT